jgi:sulfonate transport system substrate-binding protein
MQRRTFTQAVGAASLGLFGISKSYGQAAKPSVIRIGFPNAGTGGRPVPTGSFPASADLLGEINDEFKNDGIRVEWRYFAGAGPALNESFANGLVDWGFGHGDLPLIVGRSTGLKHKIVLSSSRFGPTYFVVPSGSSAKSIADLKGKKIATFKGTASQNQLIRWFRRAGFEEKDFRVISLNNDDTKAALATGDIDGTVIVPFDLEARGIARRIAQTPADDPSITAPGTVWVGEAFEKAYPEITQRLVTRLVKVAHWGTQEANRDKQLQLWARAGSTPYGDLKQQWSETKDLRARVNPLLDEYYWSAMTRAIQETKDFKLIRRDVTLEGWVEPKYLQQALKDTKLENYWPEYDAKGAVKKPGASVA